MGNLEDKTYRRKRRLVSLISLITFVVLLLILTWLFADVLSPYMTTAEEFRAFLDAFGWTGRLIVFGFQVLQVVVAFIPGEVIELGAGYAYGAVEGTLICLIGVAVSSSFVFLLTKKIGIRLVEAFVSRKKINELRFINTEKKLKRLIFLLFFIPGTPKDVLTYFVGLTNITLTQFLSITLIARIPSVVSSALCGQMLGVKNYITAIVVYAITGVCSCLGYWLYSKIIKHHQK